MQQEIDEKAALASIGDVNIDPAGLTLAKLNEVLQRPPHDVFRTQRPPMHALGWACGGDNCAVIAFFPVPPEIQISPSTAPVELLVTNIGFGKPLQGSVGGIHLGDSVEKLLDTCRRRGYQPKDKERRVPWNKDWTIRWYEENGKITVLAFFDTADLNRYLPTPKAVAR